VSHEPDLSTIAGEILAERAPEPRAKGFDRQQGITLVAQAIAERTRRRRWQRIGLIAGGLSAAAAVFVIAGFIGAQRAAQEAKACEGAACDEAALARVGTVAGRPFEPGQSIVAGRGRSTLIEFGPATRIALDESTELEYRQGDGTRRFGLVRGVVHLDVAKLQPGQRFLVETGDTEVEVRGTSFDVATGSESGCASPRTRVEVSHGVVDVRFRGKTFRVHQGQHWPERCEVEAAIAVPAAAPESPAPSSAEPQAAAPRVRAARHAKTPGAAPRPAPTRESELAAQNDLYSEAVAARRAGRSSDALVAYERLLTRFPNGPLAESASAGRLRLLAKLDSTRARSEARAYLSRYPRGMARAEAEALLGEP
jgi:ferric-dicitrate binding protein FerR (iron transport regulator)